MNLLKSLIATLVVIALAGADAPKKFDAAKLEGTWKYTSGAKYGEKVAEDRLAGDVVITKDTFTMPAGPDMKFVMEYKLDASKTPAHIDFSIKDGPVKEGKAEGIIEINGDELKLCYGVVGTAKRPEKFESTAENKAHLFTLKRAK